MSIANPGNSILAPAIGAMAGLIMGEVWTAFNLAQAIQVLDKRNIRLQASPSAE
jgi:hypothetical protein